MCVIEKLLCGDSERIGRGAITTDHNQTSHYSSHHLIHFSFKIIISVYFSKIELIGRSLF